MAVTTALWALGAFCLTFWLQIVQAGELPVLNLCSTSQNTNNVGTALVRLFQNKGESRLEKWFRFQEREETSGCREEDPTVSEKIKFTSGGYLSIEQETREMHKMFVWYSPEEFCVQLSSEKRLQAVPLVNCTMDAPRPQKKAEESLPTLMVPKCCPPGYALDYKKWEAEDLNHCVLSDLKWAPKFYDPESFDGDVCVRPSSNGSLPKVRFYTQDDIDTEKFWYSLGPKRPLMDHLGLLWHHRVRWRLLNNGSFAKLLPSTNKWHPYGRWRVKLVECADMLVNIDGIGNPESVEFFLEKTPIEKETHDSVEVNEIQVPETTRAPETDEPTTAAQGSSTEVEQEDEGEIEAECDWDKVTIIYIVCFFLSAPFLLLTIAAFVLTRKSQSVYGWTMLSHLATFLITNVAFGVALWMSACIKQGEATSSCTFVGFVVTFSFLSVFVWLTCVNFELWWTFRELRATSTNRSLMRYYIYAAISIGVPLMFTLTGYILDVTYGEHGYDSDCDIILPEFGLTRCFLTPASEGVYVFYPLLVLLFLNIVFFLMTASKIHGVRASTKLVREPTEGIDKEAILLFGKLFVVMGTSCIFEFISWFAQPELGGHEQEQNLVFVAIDFINYLGRSIVLFLIFGCKKQVKVEARRVLVRWGILKDTTFTSSASFGGTRSSAAGAADGASSAGGTMKMRTLQKKGDQINL